MCEKVRAFFKCAHGPEGLFFVLSASQRCTPSQPLMKSFRFSSVHSAVRAAPERRSVSARRVPDGRRSGAQAARH